MSKGGRSEEEWRAIFASIELVDSPGHVFRVVENRIHEIYYRLTPRPDVSPRQIAVLRTLFKVEKATQTELANLINLDRSTLSEMSSRMIERGLLKCSVAEHDRRAMTLQITAEGKEALFETIEPVLQAQQDVVAVLPGVLRPAFVQCLRILYEASVEPLPELTAADGSGKMTRKARTVKRRKHRDD